MPIPTPQSGMFSHSRSKITHSPAGDAFVFLNVITYQLEASVRPKVLVALTETFAAELINFLRHQSLCQQGFQNIAKGF